METSCEEAVVEVRRLCRVRHNRRTFLTTAEMLEVPHYALKKLANHASRQDVTSGYIVVTVERIRIYMDRISDHFLKVLGVDMTDLFS